MKIVFLTGAGMSAESGIQTFRDANGLWEGYDVNEVATPEGWFKNPSLVLDFYNQRRKQLKKVHPNDGHLAIAALEKNHEVWVITQNVDNLHEKAGSTNIIHLHGELTKVRSVANESIVLEWEDDLLLGDTDQEGNQLRPQIVWFGEMVPELNRAQEIIRDANLVVVIGTSLQVYPAAGLMHEAPYRAPVVYIDLNPATIYELIQPLHVIEKGVSEGMKQLTEWIENGKFGI